MKNFRDIISSYALDTKRILSVLQELAMGNMEADLHFTGEMFALSEKRPHYPSHLQVL
ncbi:MAG: hypothetical protein HC906_16565 [Bacteroidales bacterium]|nr:hypothetical protein [Bacteroidales bacterium]